MKISQAFPSKYLKATDIQGHTPSVVIASVRMEDIGDDDQKPVLYFQGKSKGLVLNKTNATNITLAYGDDTDAWIGQTIVLFTAWVDFQGRSVEAIRVRPPQLKDHPQHVSRAVPPLAPVAPATQGPTPERDPFNLDDSIPF